MLFSLNRWIGFVLQRVSAVASTVPVKHRLGFSAESLKICTLWGWIWMMPIFAISSPVLAANEVRDATYDMIYSADPQSSVLEEGDLTQQNSRSWVNPVNKLWLPTLYLPKVWTDSLADFWVDSLRKRWNYERAVLLRDSVVTFPDSTQYFYDSAGITFNSQVIRPKKDPFDPFSNTLYIRRGQAKFWFVGVSLVFLLLFFYYRSAFVKQFDLRIKGVFSSYYFDEMMNDKSFEYQGGTAVVLLMGNLVFSMGVMLYLRFGGFLALNAGWFYWVVFGAVVAGVMVLQSVQFLFAYALNMTETVRRQNQRQLNTNFVLALGFLPVFIFVYYNANLLSSINIPSLVSFMLIIWIVARSILSFVGLSKDRQLDFTAFLYFCTLEVLPYALFFSLLSKT